MVDVGPELFKEEGAGIDADVQAPSAGRVRECSFSRRVVEVGDSGCCSRADDLAGVEGVVACIVAGYDGATKGVAGALPEASATEGVVAAVLMGDRRHDEFDEVVFIGLVDEGVPKISAIGGGSLMKLRCGVGGLVVACDDSGQEDRGIVEAVLSGGEELLFYGLRREMDVGADGTKVGNDAEDAFGLLSLICGCRSRWCL